MGRTLSESEGTRIREFARTAPRLFLELGSGSGGHLVERAAQLPEAHFIGFELRFKRCFVTAKKAAQRGLDKVLVVRTDAKVFPTIISPGKVEGVYVNFPDPWDKSRWKKNRLLGPASLQSIAEILQTGGFLAFKTDHQEYFQSVKDSLREMSNFFIEQETTNLYASEFLEGNIQTEFEKLFFYKNCPIGYLRCVKR